VDVVETSDVVVEVDVVVTVAVVPAVVVDVVDLVEVELVDVVELVVAVDVVDPVEVELVDVSSILLVVVVLPLACHKLSTGMRKSPAVSGPAYLKIIPCPPPFSNHNNCTECKPASSGTTPLVLVTMP